HSRRRRREERLWPQEVAQQLLGVLIDLTHEQRVRPDLPAKIRQRRDDVRGAPQPLAIALLVERGVPLVPTGRQQRTRSLLARRVRVREDVECGDADERRAGPTCEPLRGGDRDAKTRE